MFVKLSDKLVRGGGVRLRTPKHLNTATFSIFAQIWLKFTVTLSSNLSCSKSLALTPTCPEN